MLVDLSNFTILIISNDAALSRLLRPNLSECGYYVIIIKGNEGQLTKIINEVRPGLIIVDAEISRICGLETLLSIRQWSSIPTILLSSCRVQKDKVHYFDIYSRNCMSNHLGMDELMRKIETIFYSAPMDDLDNYAPGRN